MSQQTTPPTPPTYDNAHLAIVVDVWKHSVGVQMHFNDMGMKIRNLYFTVIAAAIGLVGVVQGRVIEVQSPPLTIHVALFVVAAVIPISMLFQFLDQHWYHRLLIGAVKQCAFIENRYKDVLPEIQLGASISKESPVKFSGIWRRLFWFVSDPRFRDEKNSHLHSDAKIEVLYKSVIWTMVLLLIPYVFFNGIEYNHCSLAALTVHADCTPYGTNNWTPVTHTSRAAP